MSGEIVDAAAATESSAVETSAPTQPGAQPATPAEPQAPFHQHPRFQELIAQNRDMKSQNGQLTQQVQQLTRAVQQMQQNAPRAGTPPNEEYVKAADALLKIMEVNPRLKAILSLGDAAPQLMKGYQGVQELTQAQSSALLRSGRQEISSLAEKAGLPTDEKALNKFEAIVTDIIQRTPGAEERFRQGDLSIVTEAFKDIQDFMTTLRRPTAASVLQTKDKVRNLPPAPRGGLPGGSAPPKLEPGKERQFEQNLHQKAMDMLSNLTG